MRQTRAEDQGAVIDDPGSTRGWYHTVVDDTPEMLAVLEAQRAYFASDDRIRDRAALWTDATPQECLAAVYESCEEAAFFLSRLDPESLTQALAPQPLPADTEAILTKLWASRTR